jgi:Xaa-Pro dipeptidase
MANPRRQTTVKPGEKFGLAFPMEEFDRRLEAVRKEMNSRNIEGLLLFAPATLFYLTGYNTIGYTNYQCLLVTTFSDPTLVVRLLERPVAEATTWLSAIYAYEDHEDPATAVRRAVEKADLLSKPIAAERTSPLMSVQGYRHLEEVMGTKLADGSGIVEGARVIKSSLELDYIRIAARCTEAGMRAAYKAIEAGKTENDVVAECYRAMVKGGSEFFSSQPILTSGEKSGIAHTTFHRRVLKKGDSILIEIGGVWNRYTGPLMRTAAVDRASKDVRRMYDCCLEALEATLGAIHPGARSEEVQAACQGVIDRWGYEPNFRKRIGYSVGVGYAPGWGEGHIMDLKHHDSRELRPGMVFHIVPALRQYGEYGVGLSETVTVTESGVEVITNFPRELFISGMKKKIKVSEKGKSKKRR